MKNLNKKGFTLLEVIATVAIASLLMTPLVYYFIHSSNIFIHYAVENEMSYISSGAKAYLKNELTYVNDVSINNVTTYNKLEFLNGRILKNGKQIFKDGDESYNNEFYGNTEIDGKVTGQGSLLTFTLTFKNGERERTEVYVIKTLNKTNTNITTPISTIYYK